LVTRPVSGSYTHLLEGIEREEIAITEVRVTPLTWKPPDGSYVEEDGPVVIPTRSISVMQVFTDQGIVGIGPGPRRFQEEDRRAYEGVIGRNPFDVELLGLSGGLDIACWDIIGKAKGMPVYRLLATDHAPNPQVHVYASGGVNWTYYDPGDGRPCGVDALIEEALAYKALGFDTFKWRPGTDWEEAGMTGKRLGEEVCRPLREAVGPDFNLGLEKKAYDAWTFEQCLEVAPIIDELGFLFFEQPMMDLGEAQFDDYRTLKRRMPNVMLWGGESFRHRLQARPWIEQGIYDVIQSDCIGPGITENWHIARLAHYYGRRMTPHNWISALGTMCNTHFVAGVPNGLMCEYFLYPNTPWRDALLTEPYRPVNGVITLSDEPGFGVSLRPIEELQEEFPYDPSAPEMLPNPRFPHAFERAKARERAVHDHYLGSPRGAA